MIRLVTTKFGETGPPMVILHGLLGSARNWQTIGRRLGESFRVFVPDQRNHGESPHGEHSIEALRDDVLELLNAEELDRAYLVGHSMGGLAAMAFGIAHPERLLGLVVVDIAPVSQMDRMAWIFEALCAVDLSQVRRRVDAEHQLAERISESRIRQFLLQNLRRQEDGGYTWRCNLPELRRFVEKAPAFRLPPDARYDGPTLFIGGERSHYRVQEKAELIRRHFPHAEIALIPRAGHWLHFDAPDAFLARVTEFVNSRQARERRQV